MTNIDKYVLQLDSRKKFRCVNFEKLKVLKCSFSITNNKHTYNVTLENLWFWFQIYSICFCFQRTKDEQKPHLAYCLKCSSWPRSQSTSNTLFFNVLLQADLEIHKPYLASVFWITLVTVCSPGGAASWVSGLYNL